MKEYDDFESLIKDAYYYVRKTGLKIKLFRSNNSKYNSTNGLYPTRIFGVRYPDGSESFINLNYKNINSSYNFIKLMQNSKIGFEQLINKQLLIFL